MPRKKENVLPVRLAIWIILILSHSAVVSLNNGQMIFNNIQIEQKHNLKFNSKPASACVAITSQSKGNALYSTGCSREFFFGYFLFKEKRK